MPEASSAGTSRSGMEAPARKGSQLGRQRRRSYDRVQQFLFPFAMHFFDAVVPLVTNYR